MPHTQGQVQHFIAHQIDDQHLAHSTEPSGEDDGRAGLVGWRSFQLKTAASHSACQGRGQNFSHLALAAQRIWRASPPRQLFGGRHRRGGLRELGRHHPAVGQKTYAQRRVIRHQSQCTGNLHSRPVRRHLIHVREVKLPCRATAGVGLLQGRGAARVLEAILKPQRELDEAQVLAIGTRVQ